MYKKNDPLVNSVKAIMEQNEHRRRVETKLCEELGIYSRKELPREHLANYDALLEQRIQEALHSNQQKLDVHEPEKDKLTKHDFKMLRAKKTMKEEEQDSRNPLPPSGAKERIQNKLGTGAKSSVDPSYKHQGATASDREEMDKKMEKLDEVSKEKAARYATKAVDDVSHDSFIAGGASQSAKSRGTALEFDKKAMKRQKGVNLAIKKLSGSAKVNANEDVQLDEKAPKGAKYERMVKHIKDKYKKDGLTDDEKSIAYATAHKAKKMDENLTLDDVMEEIARTLGEAKMKEIEEEVGYTGKPGAIMNRALGNDQNTLGIKIGGRVARQDNVPPVVQGRAERLATAGQVASTLTPLGASTRAVAAGTAAIQAGKNFTAGAAKGVAGSTKNVARTPTGTFTTPGGATKSGEAVGRAITNPSVRGAVGGAGAAAGAVSGISAMRNSDTSAAASTPRPAPAAAAPSTSEIESRYDQDDAENRASSSSLGNPSGNARLPPARPAAPKSAAPKPAAAPVDTNAKSKAMFQSYSDKGDDASSASFFAADKQRTAELKGMKENVMNESLSNTIRKVLKG